MKANDFRPVAWRRFYVNGSAKPATKTHLRNPFSTGETLCGRAVPDRDDDVGFGTAGDGPCVACAVQAALRTDHAPALRSHKTGGGWGATWGRVWRAGCSCGWAPSCNLSKRDAEIFQREHVVGVVKTGLGVS